MSSYMKPFLMPEIENSPGIIQIQLARVDDIQSFPRVISGKLTGDILFHPGAGFTRWEVIHSTSYFQADSRDTMEGVGKTQRFPFSIPSRGMDETLLDLMERDRFIIYYQDANLRPVVLGSKERPLSFRYTSQTGTLRNGRNQYDCLFYSESQYNKAEYHGDITDYNPLVVVRYGSLDGEVLAVIQEGETLNLNGAFDYKEVILPVMSSLSGRFATINYTKAGSPATAPIELGKTIILTSEFTFEFELL